MTARFTWLGVAVTVAAIVGVMGVSLPRKDIGLGQRENARLAADTEKLVSLWRGRRGMSKSSSKTAAPPPTTPQPTTAQPTTAQPTTAQPTTAQPTTAQPTTAQPTTAQPTTAQPTTPPPTVPRLCTTADFFTITTQVRQRNGTIPPVADWETCAQRCFAHGQCVSFGWRDDQLKCDVKDYDAFAVTSADAVSDCGVSGCTVLQYNQYWDLYTLITPVNCIVTTSPTASPTTSSPTTIPTVSPTTSAPTTSSPVSFARVGDETDLGCCATASGTVVQAITTPVSASVNDCKQLCAENTNCGAINVVADRNPTDATKWLLGDCYLLAWWPATTGNDDSDVCRCWMRDRADAPPTTPPTTNMPTVSPTTSSPTALPTLSPTTSSPTLSPTTSQPTSGMVAATLSVSSSPAVVATSGIKRLVAAGPRELLRLTRTRISTGNKVLAARSYEGMPWESAPPLRMPMDCGEPANLADATTEYSTAAAVRGADHCNVHIPEDVSNTCVSLPMLRAHDLLLHTRQSHNLLYEHSDEQETVYA